MSLHLYLNREDIPERTQFCMENDLFFNGNTMLTDSEGCKAALKVIDKATYNSPQTFIGRDSSLGALYREYLSTGCKTILNIIQHPDICFSLIECGRNAKEFVLQLKNGNALWVPDQLEIEDDVQCDVICNDKHFELVGDLITYIDSEV